MLISGLNKTTLLDYPGRVAATVFTGGCNFRCPFCHNAGLVLQPMMQQTYSEEEVLDFLKKRKGILSGVCVTGGEPTLQQDLPEFLERVKKLGLLVKLDTNGSHPGMLQELLERKLIDAVAMDVKNSPAGYPAAIGSGFTDLEAVDQSICLLKESPVELEFRTTVVRELHAIENLYEICEWIKDSPKYFLQMFEDSGELIAGQLQIKKEYHGYTEQEMDDMVRQLNKNSAMKDKVFLRGTLS